MDGRTAFDATEKIEEGAALGLSTQCWQIRTDKLLLAEHKCIGFEESNTAFIEVLPTCDFNKKWLGLTSFIDLKLPS